MKALKFSITLIEPVLVMMPGAGDPNSADGLEYLPGSSLLGALAASYLQNSRVDALEQGFRHLFLSGKVKFLNAYPLSRYGERMLPTPVSWKTSSDVAEGSVFDWSFYAPGNQQEKEAKWGEIARKNPFCTLYVHLEGLPEVEFWNAAENAELAIHVFRQDRQKVTDEGSTVFRYKSLAAGISLGGILLSDDSQSLDVLANLLGAQNLRLGRSSQAGYGLVEISNIHLDENWVEAGQAEDDCLVVTLLSDALIRHPLTGAWTVDLTPLVGTQPKRAFVRPVVTGGFNRTWGLPLPQALAVGAGSVFIFPGEPGLRSKLEGWLLAGIGERTHEGFGRLALNWNTAPELKMIKPGDLGSQLPLKLQGESAKLARVLALRMFRRRLELKLTAAVIGLSIQNQPQNAQLSRLRTVVREAMQRNSAAVVEIFLNGLKKTARDQYITARVANKTLLDWVQGIIADPLATLKYELKVTQAEVSSIGGVTLQIDKDKQGPAEVDSYVQDLALEFTLRLLDGVLKNAVKKGGNA
jgi:CRISPR-associated protein Csx10